MALRAGPGRGRGGATPVRFQHRATARASESAAAAVAYALPGASCARMGAHARCAPLRRLPASCINGPAIAAVASCSHRRRARGIREAVCRRDEHTRPVRAKNATSVETALQRNCTRAQAPSASSPHYIFFFPVRIPRLTVPHSPERIASLPPSERTAHVYPRQLPAAPPHTQRRWCHFPAAAVGAVHDEAVRDPPRCTLGAYH
ncbi:hypothetical protein HYPSUDRAFT_205137 [Hypholoma sublateritium FD-334 SS-4]|uniref:Uncharacterized protein n=1 Tax=Hypholoma sublateritium (strain FD-334 SS-4) TaxID=945553 RepID=A0A0D2PF14_HYPSF|nr:hypothetical protein HYPSUDRAFT_205137 [Hypholoma sublateritium FD-334 SS-4]